VVVVRKYEDENGRVRRVSVAPTGAGDKNWGSRPLLGSFLECEVTVAEKVKCGAETEEE
jgi:hypothetical protein